jgi:MFS family permease
VSALRAYRSLLRNGPLTRLLAGEFVSGIGDWLYLVALLIVVYEHNQDALLLGIVGAARVLPYVLLSVPAGFVADRFDRRLVLIVTDTARALIMLAIAWLVATNGPIAAIVGLAIFATCFSTFFGPTIGSYLPSLVRDERELGPANSAWASLDNLAFVVGPVLAGVLVAIGGLTVAFVLNAVSFLIVDVILWRLPASKGSAAPDVVAGAAPAPHVVAGAAPDPATAPATPAATRAPEAEVPMTVLVGLSAMEVVGSFVFGGVGVLTVFLATNTYGTGDSGTGYLNGAIGVGGLLGAVASGALVLRPNLGPTLVAGAIGTGVGLIALGFVRDLTPALVALTVAAAGSIVLEVVSTTIFQRAVPDRIRGRALGVMATVSSLAFSAGSFLLPVLADRIGVTPVLAVAGIAVTAGSIGGRVLVGGAATRPISPYEATLARVSALPIFAGVSAARLEAALRHVQPRPMTLGDVVIREGDPADRFYIIDSGRVRVTQHDGPDGHDEHELREMGPNEVFGEIGLMRSSPRTATVTAIEPGLLLALDRDDFLALVAADVRLGSRLLDLHRGPSGNEARAEGTGVSGS